MIWRLLLSVAFAGIIHPVGAEEHVLFKGGRSHREYDSVVQKLSPGDKIKFSDGEAFELDEVIKRTKYTLILSVRDGEVLRIARLATPRHFEILRSYRDGYPVIRNAGIAVPLPFGRASNEYIHQEKIPVQFLLSDLIREVNSGVRTVGDEVDLWKKLREFLMSTYVFTEIGDFKSEQLAWAGDRWVLLDWMDSSIRAGEFPFENGTVIGQFRGEVKDQAFLEFLADLEEEIRSVRKGAGPSGCEGLLRGGFSLF